MKKWDGATGQIVAIIKTPTSATLNTFLYLAYANLVPQASLQNPEGVYDDGGAGYYKMIQNKAKNGAINLEDSSGNENDGTNFGGTYVEGLTGGAMQLVAASGQFASVANSADLRIGNADPAFIEVVSKTATTHLQVLLQMMDADAIGYEFWIEGNGEIRLWIGDGTSPGIFNRSNGIDGSPGVYTYMAFSYDGSGDKTGLKLVFATEIFPDAGENSLIHEVVGGLSGSFPGNSTDDLQIGRSGVASFTFGGNNAFFGTTSDSYKFDGEMDQLWFSKGIVRPTDPYCITRANNLFRDSSFYTLTVAQVP